MTGSRAVRTFRRRRALRLERSTFALAMAALGTVGGVAVTEIGRVWHKGSAPGPVEADRLLDAAATAVAEAGEVARAGYRDAPEREAALLNLFIAFVVAFGVARVSTWTIRRRGRWGPFRDVYVGRRHVHHFVPGMILALVAGGIAI